MPKTKKVKRRPSTRARTRKASPLGRRLYQARFLPAILIATFATVLAWFPQAVQLPGRDVLAYATNTSSSGLLGATNTQRSNNGVAGLVINSKLASAAQSKANDMVTRDYWSHDTPDGKEPWTFIVAAGYDYKAAGENLAFGYLSSGDTVTGWMNSPSHKANLLSTSYTEVGFGMANSPNFVGYGQQTVVVAMYGAPQVASATTTQPSSPAPAPAAAAAASPKPAEPAPKAEQAEAEDEEEETIAVETVEDTVTIAATASPAQTKRVQLLTGGQAVWSATAVMLVVITAGLLWMVHRGIHIKRYVLAGENFVAHHLYLDLTVLAVLYLGFVLLSVGGAVR
jgi:uncharacterized protein YkwD